MTDSQTFRNVLGHFCSGIVIVTGAAGDEPVGLTAQSFSSLSLDPPLVLFCPARTSTSWPRIAATGHFCVNVLGDHQEQLCRDFARTGVDKFAGVGWAPGISGAPVLDGSIAYLDCAITEVHDGGDHLIVIGEVVDLGVRDLELLQAGPLLFYKGGYGRLAQPVADA